MFADDEPHIGIQRVFAWTGALLGGLFFVGFWLIAGFIPPPGPRESVAQIVHFYSSNTTAIHLGLYMTMLAAAFCVTFFTVITVQMRRIEGKHSPLAWAQLVFGGLFAIEFIIPLMFWQTADYRPLLDPAMTYRLDDMGWLFFIGVVSTGVVQAVLIGIVILRDRRPEPVFPRWVAYLSIWTGLLFMPGGLIVFFKTGPLDWRGLVAWWLLLAAFGVWLVVLIWALLTRAIPHHQREFEARRAMTGTAPPTSAG